MIEPDQDQQQLSSEERAEWHRRLAKASRNNVFCHCCQRGEEWVASEREVCHQCVSSELEAILPSEWLVPTPAGNFKEVYGTPIRRFDYAWV